MSASKDYVREPKTKFDYSLQSCLPYLQGALIEFRDDYPDWYMFITENKLVHYGSSKYILLHRRRRGGHRVRRGRTSGAGCRNRNTKEADGIMFPAQIPLSRPHVHF